MRIATLSIGDELIFGEIVDTNAPFIAARLYDMGLKVTRHLAVGDVEAEITAALQSLAAASDTVIVTGGLGPTGDDVTARAAAKACGRRLVLNDEALAHLRDFLGKRGKGVDSANEKQALIPAKASLIPNPTGTACGFYFPLHESICYFLPGVPAEMKRMLEESVFPLVRARLAEKKVVRDKVFKLFGLQEAEVDTLLKGVVAPGSPLQLAFRVDFPEIQVKLRAEGDDAEEVTELLEGSSAKVRKKLHRYIFAEDDETIDSMVAALFREKGLTLALAESCTGGLVAKRITDIPGSSAYFLEGAVTYDNAAKTRELGISAELLREKGAVSSEVAMAMAKGMRKRAGSDIALAVTGIAGPAGGTPEKPVGTVFLAISTNSGCQAKGYRFPGGRNEIRTVTAFMALDWLRRHLLTC